ncbi:hypothetical protein ACFLV3_03715 [Chloroflexota bacterium]
MRLEFKPRCTLASMGRKVKKAPLPAESVKRKLIMPLIMALAPIF